MNRLLTFPLILMLMLALFSLMLGGHLSNNPDETNISGSVQVNGSTNQYNIGYNVITSLGTPLTILSLAIGAAIILGVSIFGSKAGSTYSQELVFKAGIYLSLWVMLTAMAYPFFTQSDLGFYGVILYLGLTLIYIIGFGHEVRDVGGE